MHHSTVLTTGYNRKGILEYKEKYTGISKQIFTKLIGSWLYHDLTVYLFIYGFLNPHPANVENRVNS
jgi:hypothetical protein